MRSHRFINSLLCLVILLVVKERKAKENAGIRPFFVLFSYKRHISLKYLFSRDGDESSVLSIWQADAAIVRKTHFFSDKLGFSTFSETPFFWRKPTLSDKPTFSDR